MRLLNSTFEIDEVCDQKHHLPNRQTNFILLASHIYKRTPISYIQKKWWDKEEQSDDLEGHQTGERDFLVGQMWPWIADYVPVFEICLKVTSWAQQH